MRLYQWFPMLFQPQHCVQRTLVERSVPADGPHAGCDRFRGGEIDVQPHCREVHPQGGAVGPGGGEQVFERLL
jgi:hypothetical protein